MRHDDRHAPRILTDGVLTIGTPVRQPRSFALFSRADRSPAAAAWSASAAVNMEIVRRVRVRASGEKATRFLDEAAEPFVGERADFCEGVDAAGEEDFRFPDVPDAGDCALIEERIRNFHLAARTDAAERLLGIEVG